jgi:hypothetical protein
MHLHSGKLRIESPKNCFEFPRILFAKAEFNIEFAGSCIEFGRSWIDPVGSRHNPEDPNQDLADLN